MPGGGEEGVGQKKATGGLGLVSLYISLRQTVFLMVDVGEYCDASSVVCVCRSRGLVLEVSVGGRLDGEEFSGEGAHVGGGEGGEQMMVGAGEGTKMGVVRVVVFGVVLLGAAQDLAHLFAGGARDGLESGVFGRESCPLGGVGVVAVHEVGPEGATSSVGDVDGAVARRELGECLREKMGQGGRETGVAAEVEQVGELRLPLLLDEFLEGDGVGALGA